MKRETVILFLNRVSAIDRANSVYGGTRFIRLLTFVWLLYHAYFPIYTWKRESIGYKSRSIADRELNSQWVGLGGEVCRVVIVIDVCGRARVGETGVKAVGCERSTRDKLITRLTGITNSPYSLLLYSATHVRYSLSV